MKHAFSASILIALFAIAGTGQTPSKCPKIRVTSPDSAESGQAITYTVNLTGGGDDVSPTYNWSVSAGTISSGQGTSTIFVDTDGLSDTSVTATVELGGYDPLCARSNSSTTSVLAVAKARMVDSTMKVNAQERLKNLALELQNSPTDQAYIIAYGGQKSYPGEAAASLKRAKDFLVKETGIDPERIVTVDGGYKEQAWRELWIVPPGATPPSASPSLDPSEVVIAKPAAKKKSVGKKS